MKTDLLKEAIADADAIKKLAIENAKASLNQAFDSKIKSMLAARLQEEVGDEDVDDEDTNEEKEMGEYDEAKKPKEDEEDDKHDEMDEIDINKILAEMEDSEDSEDAEDEEEVDEAKKDEEDEEDDKHDEVDEAKKDAEDEEDAEDEGYGVDEEVDLNELLRELEEGNYDEAKKPKEDAEDAEDEEDEEPSKSKSKSKSPEMIKMEKEHAAEIYEIRKQASRLTQKVNETNLINAKLLYLNKILNKHNLNEAQKVKVISAFDRASTVKEAKIVFESLNEAFVVKTQKSKTNLKESLGLASKAAGNSTKRDIITEADVQVARWQKLAGINKTI